LASCFLTVTLTCVYCTVCVCVYISVLQFQFQRFIFRSTPKSRPNNIYMRLKCPSVRMYVRTSVRTKIFSDSYEIWYVDRGRWVMHDGMSYDPIQGQGQGHETFKFRNSSIFFNFRNVSPPAFLVWAGNWPLILKLRNNYLTFARSRFLISVLVFVSRDFELGRVSGFGGVDRSPVRGFF